MRQRLPMFGAIILMILGFLLVGGDGFFKEVVSGKQLAGTFLWFSGIVGMMQLSQQDLRSRIHKLEEKNQGGT